MMVKEEDRLRQRIAELEARLAERPEGTGAFAEGPCPEDLDRIRRRCDVLLKLPQELDSLGEQDLMTHALSVMEELTGSLISFTHFVHEDQQHLESAAWSSRTLQTYCNATPDGHYPVSQAGIWADALRQRKAVTFNDYAAYEGKMGLPEGHARLDRLISVPVIENGKVVVLSGVGNKASNYTDFDVQSVQLVSSLMWRMIRHRRMRRKLLTIYETAPVGIGLLSNRVIVDINPALARMVGREPSDLIGQPTRRFYPSEDEYDHVGRALYSQLELTGQGTVESRLLKSDGTVIMARMTARVINRQKPDRGIVVTVTDITEQLHMQQEIERHQHELEQLVEERTSEMEAALLTAEVASRARSALLTNLSHEMRTPLNAVVGLSHLLGQQDPGPEITQQLKKIERAGRRLQDMIGNLLDLADIESAALKLVDTELDLAETVQQVHVLMGEAARSKGLRLKIDCKGLPWRLLGDPIRITQALLNYVSNAIKFSENGEVLIRVRVREQDDRSALIRFEVQDSGSGIRESDLPRLFRAFSPVGDPHSPKPDGIGLGLAITRHLANMMGGSTGVESTLGKGSTFWFTARLSLAETRQSTWSRKTSGPAEDELKAEHSGKRILLVEDDLINSEVARALLSRAGLEVEVAANGQVAVEKAMDGRFDLMLTDIRMPVMDGLEATRRIRAHEENADMPIVALTAHVDQESRIACREAGMNDFLGKPVDAQTLYEVILKWFRRMPLGGAND